MRRMDLCLQSWNGFDFETEHVGGSEGVALGMRRFSLSDGTWSDAFCGSCEVGVGLTDIARTPLPSTPQEQRV